MSNEKRLQNIKENLFPSRNSYERMTKLFNSDLEWLIEQAEKVERYEMMYENTGAIFNRQHMRERIEFLEKELYQQKELTALWKEKYLEENKKLLKMIED